MTDPPSPQVRRVEWLALLLAVAALLVFRLPFLPPTLDDIDSVNFDLGVPDKRRGSHTPAEHECGLRRKCRKLIEERTINARHDVLEVAKVLRVLEPVHDEAAALREDRP